MTVKACRLWLNESGGTLYTPPDLALPSTVKLDTEKLEIKFSKHPLIMSLCRHHRWHITPEYKDYVLLEAKITGKVGQLSFPGNAAKYDIKIPKPDDAIAYYFSGIENNKTPLTVEVVEKITKPSQILIYEGGIVNASENLSGETVKVRTLVIYNQATEELNEKIEKLDANILFKVTENNVNRWKFLQLKRCDYEPIFGNKIKLVNWEFSREDWL